MIVAREIVDGKGYYFSHGTAMQIHQMVTQPRLPIYTSVIKPRRPIHVLGTEFRFVHTPKKLFFGITEYCGGVTEVAKGLWMQRQNMNHNRLMGYAKKTGVGAVIRRLGFLLELYQMATAEDLEIHRKTFTNVYVCLDPLLPAEGKFLRRWRLQLNVSREELLSVAGT